MAVDYLDSPDAIKDVERDSYWPKWHSPWWHMLLLHEMGETKRIPKAIVSAFIASLNRMPLKIFPIHDQDMPSGVDPYRQTMCHCQLGNVYQVLAAWGVDLDSELPWIRPWFLRYQMSDGGLNCDNSAYLVKDEVASSMVGTIAAFEAVLLYTPRPWTIEGRAFLDRAARFLIDRKLTQGSPTKHNAAERKSALQWRKLCFPRFYMYDVLRGLNALTLWAEKTRQPLPKEAIAEVVRDLQERFSDGKVRCERNAHLGMTTLLPAQNGEWIRSQPATTFPLFVKTGAVNEVSPFLTQQWADVRRRLQTF
jgi:hypothetical protein